MMAALKPFLDELEEDLTCSICHDIFTEPKCLPCFHSFCEKCIVEWYNRSGNPDTEKFDCPICRTRVDLPGGDASKLTPSFYLGSLPRLLRAMRNKSADQEQTTEESKCEGCEKPCRLTAFCPQCNCLICDDCVNAHKNLKHLREEHHPTFFSEFGQESVNAFIRNQMVCKEKYHEKNKFEYYCKEETCRRCVCQKCAILYHQNHQMQNLEETAEEVKKRLQGEMDRVDKLKGKYEEELGQSKGNMQRIQNEVDSAKNKVQETEEMLCRIVKEHTRAMINDLHLILRDQKEANEEEKNDIDTGIKHLSDFKEYTQALMQRNVACELVESKDALLEQSEALCKTTSILRSKPIKRNMTVDYVAGKGMQSFNDIGRIVKSFVDPLNSTIEPVKEVGRCGFLNSFHVVTRNTEGEACHTTEPVEIKIKDVEGKEVQKGVYEKQNGTYVVIYRASIPLPYSVMVKVGGEPIRNSPKQLETLSMEEEFKPKRFEVDDKGVLNGPQSLAVSSDGEVAIADTGNNRVQIFDLKGKYLRKFGSQGTEEGIDGVLIVPFAVAFIEDSIIVGDAPSTDSGRRIQEFDLTGKYVRTLVKPEEMMNIVNLCIKDGTFIAVCCSGGVRRTKSSIKVLNRRGELLFEFDSEKNESPFAIECGNGKYFVAYGNKNYIRVFDENGVGLRKFGRKGENDGQFNTICGLSMYGPNMIVVCDYDNSRVQLLTEEGQFVRSFGSFGQKVGFMMSPVDVVVTADGGALVLDHQFGRVHVWS